MASPLEGHDEYVAGLAQDLANPLERQPDLLRGASRRCRRGSRRRAGRRCLAVGEQVASASSTRSSSRRLIDDPIDGAAAAAVSGTAASTRISVLIALELVEREEPRLADREARELESRQRTLRVLLDQPRPRHLRDLAGPIRREPQREHRQIDAPIVTPDHLVPYVRLVGPHRVHAT